MSKNGQTVLIPWTLRPGTRLSVALADVGARSVAHLEGLLAWLAAPEISSIVIVKNCPQPICAEALRELAESHHKEIEIIQTQSPEEVKTRGKGYGEGALLASAIEKSQLLASRESFLKCTGKLFAPNHHKMPISSAAAAFHRCLRPTRPPVLLPAWVYSSESVVRLLFALRVRLRMPWNAVAYSSRWQVDTRFYWVRKEFYLEHLKWSYRRVCEPLGYNLEDAFYQDLADLAGVFYHEEEPVILGRSGTLGTQASPFSNELREKAIEWSCRLLPQVPANDL